MVAQWWVTYLNNRFLTFAEAQDIFGVWKQQFLQHARLARAVSEIWTVFLDSSPTTTTVLMILSLVGGDGECSENLIFQLKRG